MLISTQEHDIHFATRGGTTGALRIDGRGNVAVGNEDPTNNFDVAGSVAVGLAAGTVAPTKGLAVGGPVQAYSGRPVNTQVGTAYTLALTDSGGTVTCSNASAVTLTVPPNSSVAFAVGVEIVVFQLGAGLVTIAAGAGVTVSQVAGTLKMLGQYSRVVLTKTGTNTWVANGDLSAT